ncbi:MAG: hypothetical protein J3R72DRAFT_187593 [Linnemannia gamsii]|nr:MAG: hypothetical protein J3R72DRAFT_187593 [Linnemannia gamsii]
MIRGLIPAEDDQEQEERVQAIRSVNRNTPPTEVSSARPEEIYYVDCQVDPVTQKEFILWDDILQAFEDGVHVRNKAKIVPFLKGPDYRVLEPRRIAPAPNTVLDVIVRDQLTDSRPSSHQVALPLSPPQEKREEENEEEKLIEDVVASQNVTATLRFYGLEEEAMNNYYSHIDKPIDTEGNSPIAITQAFEPTLLQEKEGEEEESRAENDAVTQNDAATSTVRRNPVYGLEEEAMDNYSHIDKPIYTEGNWPIAITQASAPTSFQREEEEESMTDNDSFTQNIAATSTIRRNPVYRLGEAVMENCSHIDPADTGIGWSNDIPKVSDKTNKDDAVSQNADATSFPRRNPAFGLVEAAMENYTHIERPTITSSRGPQAVLSSTDEESMTLQDSNLHSLGPQEYISTSSNAQPREPQEVSASGSSDLAITIIRASQGDSDAQVLVGDLYKDGQGVQRNYLTALDWYLKAARQGHAVAQCKIGVLYDQGFGVTQDYTAAMDWYLKAAQQGNSDAQCNIGILYAEGHDVSQDFSHAIVWYLKAAEQGFARAQCNIGAFYELGEGVPQNFSQALQWYLKAAEQGHPRAQCSIGELYEAGQGVSSDFSKAVKWYQQAADLGFLKAKKRLETLERNGHSF